MASTKQAFKGGKKVGGRRLFTTAQRSIQMARVRRTATAPEQIVRRLISSLGLRYTLENGDLPGSPDLANRRRRFAIFVHGCFWHRHKGCKRTTTPRTNRWFWQDKFDANVTRDRAVVRRLRQLGFRVLVIWECATLRQDSLTKLAERLTVLRR